MEQREYVVADDDTVELRFDCPKAYVAVLDAICAARGGSAAGQSRGKLVIPVIGAFVEAHIREATMVTRVLRGNPLLPESAGQGCGSPTAPTTIERLSAQMEELRRDVLGRKAEGR